ncbi:UTP-hexose-1-phosphate uridylyltransferase /UDP-glucose-hexose-1-phosphate uridylyltransferase [Aliiruegeria haliotis]|uniref:Galactose-1-phosphate uridylyltransferase n=1 Tax=Aliiruegeria haliotis TaxID=1280846 RepID=A0A2T0RZU8_9RHOB|nr:UDP-glucose--hexose-1-phosphate uridylyltransferase [Aliiruegeria haliotis]PRY26707.1 UTP-hexose-1-phosphate uridylyltransferase /UDP-glucose-hexose-1-phosphate uridylyltransferase [Aliiruegeria haliotis]
MDPATLATNSPHRRFNPLKGEWVLVSPHRTQRPWLGQEEDTAGEEKPRHDPKCYLCPGNTRTSGAVNPDFVGPFVFPNDFPAMLDDTPKGGTSDNPLFQAENVRGTARVMCFSERHDLTLPELPVDAIRKVVDTWAEQIEDLGATYDWVAVFENKGAVMGCSQPHPHGQIWASDFLPNEVATEDETQSRYLREHGQNLLLEYATAESAAGERTVVENEHWIAVVPYWAIWPFETLVLPKAHVLRLPDLSGEQRQALADLLKRLTTRYDNLFQTEFPYTMGWHGAPTRAGTFDHWQLHAHFYPPLLRSATVRKFMVGFEMLAEAQRDLTAETAAERLRDLSDVHYKAARALGGQA